MKQSGIVFQNLSQKDLDQKNILSLKLFTIVVIPYMYNFTPTHSQGVTYNPLNPAINHK